MAQRRGNRLKGHPVTLVRSVLREPLPLAAAFRQAGRPGPGGAERAKEALPTVGHDPGFFGIKGLAARVYFVFTHSSPPIPAAAPATRPWPDGANHQGQERGRGATRGTGGNGWALRRPMNRANPGPGPTAGFRRLPWAQRPPGPALPRDLVGPRGAHTSLSGNPPKGSQITGPIEVFVPNRHTAWQKTSG